MLEQQARHDPEAVLDDVLPGACLSRVISPTTSPAMTWVLFHSGSLSVVETTYFGIALIWSETGSPERVGQTGAKPS